MNKQDRATSSMNDTGTGGQIDTPLTQLRSLAVRLASADQHLPEPAAWIARCLVQQSKFIKSPEDHERLRPYIADYARRFQEAMSGNQ